MTSSETPSERRARLKAFATSSAPGIKAATGTGSRETPKVLSPGTGVTKAGGASQVPVEKQREGGSPGRKRSRNDMVTEDAAKEKIKLGVSGLEVAVPDPTNPACQKVVPVLRYVPHAHISLTKKAKAYRLISPMTYGACVAEQEAGPGLTLEDCEDLALQKLGEAGRYVTMVRELAAAECNSKDRKLSEQAKALGKELDSLKVERDAAKVEEAKYRNEVARLGVELKALSGERDELKDKLSHLAKAETDEVLAMYDATVRLAMDRGKTRYPDSGVDWDDLFELGPQALDTALNAVQ